MTTRQNAPTPAGAAPSSVAREPACLLALDTATEVMALAVLAPGGLHTVDAPGGLHTLNAPGGRHTLNAPGGAVASAQLLPAVQRLMADAGCRLADVAAIAFGQGPGAFTGLRTACAVAQGLGFGLGRPLLAIDSLLVVAEDARHTHGGTHWWVAMDARMDEVYAAQYRFGHRHDDHGHDRGDAPTVDPTEAPTVDPTGRRPAAPRWHTTTAPRLYTLPALAALWAAQPPQAVAGSALAAFGSRLPVGQALCQPEQADRAAALLRLAEAAWADGQAIDPADALPLYLRDKVALTTAERQARPLPAAVSPAPAQPDAP